MKIDQTCESSLKLEAGSPIKDYPQVEKMLSGLPPCSDERSSLAEYAEKMISVKPPDLYRSFWDATIVWSVRYGVSRQSSMKERAMTYPFTDYSRVNRAIAGIKDAEQRSMALDFATAM